MARALASIIPSGARPDSRRSGSVRCGFTARLKGDRTLYGQVGCNLELAHELGHVLGARKHAPQGARALHGTGPVMCGWESDCIDPARTDFSEDEDVPLICGDGGHGGRCSQW